MMSPEKIMELGRQYSGLFLSNLSIDERLGLVKDVPVNERLKLLKDIPVTERLKDIPISEIEAYLSSQKAHSKIAY